MITFLKRLRVIAVSAGFAAALSSCADSVGPRTPDPLVQRLIDMGFSPKEIVDRGTYFIVEGDILFLKDALREPAPVAPNTPFDLPQFQWRTNNSVWGTIQNVKVSISPGLSAGWAAATRQAMVEWITISGTIIEFVEAGPADITVSSVPTLPGGAIAQASFPANGKPGSTIQVSSGFESYTASAKLFIMAHEFGHTIGFRHSNWSVNLGGTCGSESANPAGAIRIGSTPETDAASVMNKCSGGTPWDGFSFWDVEAARVFYPVRPVVRTNDQVAGDTIVLTWTPVEEIQYSTG